MGKTNQIEYGFLNFLPHRFAIQTAQSIFAASFYGFGKKITFAPQLVCSSRG
jgi:hypothetical protein